MSCHTKVLLPNGMCIKRSQARRLVEQCAYAWLEEGRSLRKLSVAEMVTARSQQIKDREPLPLAEIYGLKYEPVPGAESKYRESRLLAYEAYQFTVSETSAA